jgi:hypothetical protein
VDKYGIKQPSQPDCAHITRQVFALRVESAADRQHSWRWVNQGQVVMSFQMGGIVTAAAAQFQQSLERTWAGFAEHLVEKDGFLGIVSGR